jgi:ubiquinone/menaquinone biosynthesis C-methylase UbiE
MYQAIQSMGLQRDSWILEPACGTGNFITRMPHSIGNAGVVGVEIDSITAEIASRLHNDRDNVKILNCGFEHSGLPDGSFDLAIGNVPFGDYKMNDHR